MPFESYDYEFEPAESVEAPEFADEASRRPYYPPRPIPGALSSATLHTPRGPATLTLPTAVPTLTQFRALEQTVNTTRQRVDTLQAGIARISRELAVRRRDQDGQATTFPLLSFLIMRRLLDDGGGTQQSSSLKSILPFLLLCQPNLLSQSSTSSRDSGMGGFSPILLLLLFDKL